MPVLHLDPTLLTAGSATLEAAIADVAGEPDFLRFDGAWPDRLPDDARGFLASVPALTAAVGAPPEVATAFDVAFERTADADAAVATFEAAPHASCAAALLVRTAPADTWAGLVAESATYSMLQSGPEFAAWRASREEPAPPPAADAAPRVRVRREGRVTEIVLTRPGRRNALDVRMRDELHAALTDELGRSGPVVVRGEGASFCEGGDLDEFGTFPDPVAAHAVRLGRSLAWRFAQLAPRLVVGLHGAAVGSGIELPAFAGRVVAADHTRIALPELRLGLIPGAGGTVSIPRRSGRQRFLALLLRGGTIPASIARDWGLVDEVVPRAELETRLLEIAESIVT
ncbi:MAG TPA: enoyl-CoA hydratase/isomerase family protein [Acidimicrobiia bacterium]|nr:enoyl-CoA hydratase/isomerase family protein [Acidimicrobiia bacterium]